MKITEKQRIAASLYWTQILTGERIPKALIASKQGLPPFMASMGAMHRHGYLEKLEKENPTWSLEFMNELDSLLVDADQSYTLRLEYHPEGFLKDAAQKAGVSEGLFPSVKLIMTFDHDGHIIVGDEKIDSDTFIKSVAREIAEFKM